MSFNFFVGVFKFPQEINNKQQKQLATLKCRRNRKSYLQFSIVLHQKKVFFFIVNTKFQNQFLMSHNSKQNCSNGKLKTFEKEEENYFFRVIAEKERISKNIRIPMYFHSSGIIHVIRIETCKFVAGKLRHLCLQF